MKAQIILILFFGFFYHQINAQTAIIKGRVTDSNGKAIENVNVFYDKNGTTTNSEGIYALSIPSNRDIEVEFSHISFQIYKKRFRAGKGKTIRFSPKLKLKTENIDEVIVKDENKKAAGLTNIKTKTVKNLPSANQSIESVLKTLPGVNFNNELSTQYNVRGGSFEENLVYINGIEVYRPFLIRSGQQEGLSIVNPNLTQNVNFSAGGFQAKYGDKLSSVLDIQYRRPTNFGVAIEASLIGASVTAEGVSKNNKFRGILGARYRNNSLFLNNSDINSNFKPSFTDIQTFLTYDFTEKFSLEFLGSFSINKYDFKPISRRTNFGTIINPVALVVNYQGKENDRYQTIFGALKANYSITDDLTVSLTSSTYNTQEQEYYDILASYGIGEINADFGSDNFGDVDFVQAIGTQLDHARNNLKAQISNVNIKATLRKNLNLFEVGFKYQNERFNDQVIEWQVIDSAGFSIRPPNLLPINDEPYTPYTGPIVPFVNVRAKNNITVDRFSGFAQWSKKTNINDHILWLNVGVRAQYWNVKGENINSQNHFVISPRAQISLKPNWDKDMLFRLSGGYYHQPPFYRELRDSLGIVHPEVKAQQSIHFVLGNDFSFKMWNRPFKLVSEVYYKSLTNVNPFTIDNVRIRYRAENNAIAYATGFDIRLNGEFVPGTESWFSFGYLLTKENIENRGYISRPTDQRLKFAILFQDYVPSIPNLKMYLNMVYNTGVPGGSPSYADPYLFQNRLKDYFRSDIGLSYIFVDFQNPSNRKWLEKFKELSLGVELFNMFDIQNSITNTWVKDISSNRSIAIPNYLSGRILNVKVAMRF